MLHFCFLLLVNSDTAIQEVAVGEKNIAEDISQQNRSFADPRPLSSHKNEPQISPQLSRLMQDLRTEILPDQDITPDWYRQFRRLPNESVHRTPFSPVVWHPVYCRTAGIEWIEERIISEGNTNVVSIVRDIRTDKRYIHKSYDNPDEFLNEVHFLAVASSHEYFVKPICHQREIDQETKMARPALLIEYIEGKNGHEYAMCCASEKDLQRISAQLLVALEYLQWLGFVHADWKPKNFLVKPDGNIVVIDFGFSTRVEYARKGRGTPATISPEISFKAPGQPSEAADWWAYGVTIAMLHGARLRAVEASQAALKAGDRSNPNHYLPKPQAIRADDFSSRNPQKNTRRNYVPICLRDEEYERQATPAGFSHALRHFILMFLSLDPEERRFNSTRLLAMIRSHPFFEGIDWSKMPSPMSQATTFQALQQRAFVPSSINQMDDVSNEEEEEAGDSYLENEEQHFDL